MDPQRLLRSGLTVQVVLKGGRGGDGLGDDEMAERAQVQVDQVQESEGATQYRLIGFNVRGRDLVSSWPLL
jgi:hypothetical protein